MKKYFVIPNENARKAYWIVYQMLHTFNKTKVGRNLRKTIVLVHFEGQQTETGDLQLSITFDRNRPHCFRYRDVSNNCFVTFYPYKLHDHKRALARLTKLQSKPRR